ncbi:phosphatase PAP2 family protein [Pyxidicoccus sp. MSG2]|uniref:phosphatase PAP2 family protein n=1 Tax=Pyxidicoccus sp. MSG2 TaxID=2996790 RepID=UPI00226D611D|nr:phosphatase PAP2 family protein [Pyxidicoccus sp. MSG2]MCY1021105.1 phosphatase PAP2 family protein [Pyxidicoccus sp. MSG2]
MLVLTSDSQLPVAAPADVNSEAYKAELAAIKDAQSKLTEKQRKAIAYWSGGGVLRWNQILRELVARYNLQPAPKADGSYPAPDAENPFADPGFPFANPPYAARAYSYVAVAQYEALKAAWHYKYLYNRPAPHQVDGSIQALRPATELPAYPSEDALLSGVSAEMLKVLFPAAVEHITLKAAEQRNAALWSGMASASDLAAGVALGKAVADEMKRRAAGDGMSKAAGTKADWQKLEDDCAARDEIPWISREVPMRPPMLPFFGQVKAWSMTKEEIESARPPRPYSTSSEEMKKETEEVKWYADNVTRERLAIVHKWADGAGTYTPAGHWNDIAAEYVRDARFSEVRAARAFALLNMALHDAAVGCWDTKYHYFTPRPSQMNLTIKTCTGIPNFPSFTSGHSTFSGSAATVLSYLFPNQSEFFHEQAKEASDSRLFAGIHFRADIEMGLEHGKVIGGHIVTLALTDGADDAH